MEVSQATDSCLMIWLSLAECDSKSERSSLLLTQDFCKDKKGRIKSLTNKIVETQCDVVGQEKWPRLTIIRMTKLLESV